MEVFITDKYLNRLEVLFRTAQPDQLLDGKLTGLQSIRRLLLSLPLNTDLSVEDVTAIVKSSSGEKGYDSHKSIYIKQAVKNQCLNKRSFSETDNIFNHSAFYFKSTCITAELSNSHGVAGKGGDFTGDSFYEDCSITNLSIDANWLPQEFQVPPVNAMILTDPYIFGDPFDFKLQRLNNFIRCFNRPRQLPFHLTIVFAADKGGKTQGTPVQVEKAFETLKGNGNIEVQLIACNKDHDRLLYTNYTSGSIGNPFSRRNTVYNQNFLGSGKPDIIKHNYYNYKTELSKLYTEIKNTPSKIGLLQTRWETSYFTNRIFNPIFEGI